MELPPEVSYEFGRARTFTVIDLENDQVKNVKVVNNPAASYEHGTEPIVIVKILANMKTEVVVAGEFGLGAFFLNDKNIRVAKVEAGTNVSRAVSIIR